MFRVPTLMSERTKVVKAKAERPRGAGFPNLRFGALRRCQYRDDIVLVWMIIDSPVEAGLEVTTECSKSHLRVVGARVSQRVASFFVG